MPMFGLADVNSFYASCEALFRPDLRGKPIVVLSNNDGCVIARNAGAKALGIKMGYPGSRLKIRITGNRYILLAQIMRFIIALARE